MALKFFCDECGQEMTDKNTILNFEVEVGEQLYTVEPVGNILPDHRVCKYCVIKKVNALDDREKCAEGVGHEY